MFKDFYTQRGEQVVISAEQASRFAKGVAGDYNPIHNPDARRFCVPGDLLFTLVLLKFGLYQHMEFRFTNMVGADAPLSFSEADNGDLYVCDDAGKCFLQVTRSGDVTHDAATIAAFARCYVAFSGKNFPHYLKPLMEEHGVMFNPKRPLVIYDSMGFTLNSLDGLTPDLALTRSSLDVLGKRADALLEFAIQSAGASVGVGSKKLVVSGLCNYDATEMAAIVDEFYRLKAAYEAA
ncbi:DUF3581 domain-containing protein [Halomonas dongshanensis]|uniref:DUF3581 domain-containing protein n=1 Tax=Halomonas dongshanensis TaxID=2890835 RepID=A0ABT2EAT8_9GAMM|nr:DUF3581 domain-containing protein [Halomonas dongshanensis]MCS2608699.1 DUF3581 domain-containing protein [Halomonas dongshanensis]